VKAQANLSKQSFDFRIRVPPLPFINRIGRNRPEINRYWANHGPNEGKKNQKKNEIGYSRTEGKAEKIDCPDTRDEFVPKERGPVCPASL
jgi:hypothetical protein